MPEFIYKLSPFNAAAIFFFENLLIILLVVLIGFLIRKKISRGIPFHLTGKELLFATFTLLINTGITFLGFILWKKKIIVFHTDLSLAILPDFLVLFLSMDLAMYFLHLFIHHTALYRPVHGLHHDYHEPSPIDLFVLNPVETFSFGSLWLILIFFYPCNIYAVVIYLVLNVLFGMLGHLSVEPFPANWMRIPLANLICTSTFHYQHHKLEKYNFGFYTILWDKIFGTLAPDYKEQFLLEKQKK
ncbi:MAG: sterol desaturase family protein [Bacteroidia bacterium]